MFAAAVITVSDSCFQGSRVDISGPSLTEVLNTNGFQIVMQLIVPDDATQIEDALRKAAATAALVVTTGGTGVAPRDVTPEATKNVCDRLLDGLSERMRAAGTGETPLAILSRAVCGTLGQSLIVNVPGSPRGAVTSLQAVLPVLPHALRLLSGADTTHDAVGKSLES
jgi:molybdopterin adenylyltransferase